MDRRFNGDIIKLYFTLYFSYSLLSTFYFLLSTQYLIA